LAQVEKEGGREGGRESVIVAAEKRRSRRNTGRPFIGGSALAQVEKEGAQVEKEGGREGGRGEGNRDEIMWLGCWRR
jgi:hypothetical protein